MIQRNYRQIKGDVKDIMTYEIERILLDPALEHLVVKKGKSLLGGAHLNIDYMIFVHHKLKWFKKMELQGTILLIFWCIHR